MLPFQCLFTTSCGWLTAAVEQCHHHKDVASSIPTFLNLVVTDILTTGIDNLPATAFSFSLWSTTLSWCTIVALRFAILFYKAEGIHSTGRILLWKTCKLCQSLFAKSSATLIRSFTTFGCIVWLKSYTLTGFPGCLEWRQPHQS